MGTLFSGRVFDTANPHEVRQRLSQGNVVNEIESNRFTVTTNLSNSLLFAPQIKPNPFTPNGDGINDVTNISFKLLRITDPVPISIAIFDLSGRLMKHVYINENTIGEYAYAWDGLDHSNRHVPAGLYLYAITADFQSEQETHSGIVLIAY